MQRNVDEGAEDDTITTTAMMMGNLLNPSTSDKTLNDRNADENMYVNRIHYGYLPYRGQLHYAATTTSTSSAASAPQDVELNGNLRQQLDQARRTIAVQNEEIARLRKSDGCNSQYLRQQMDQMERELRGTRDRFLEQEELLAEMSREMDTLLREKLQAEAALRDIEKKYKKAKFASRELAQMLDNDSKRNTIMGFESDNECRENEEDETLLSRSKRRWRKKEEEDLRNKCEKYLEHSQERKRDQEEKDRKEIMEKLLIDNENLLIELDTEKRASNSFQQDLENVRRILVEKDETIIELKTKLNEAESKTQQIETDLSRTSTDLALERARCDALALELHELDAIFNQTQATVQAFAAENERLEEKCRDTQQMVISLNAKLEAQGIDLITTKRALRALRENNS